MDKNKRARTTRRHANDAAEKRFAEMMDERIATESLAIREEWDERTKKERHVQKRIEWQVPGVHQAAGSPTGIDFT